MPIGYNIPFTGLDRQYKSLREELRNASDIALSTGAMINGEHTRRFENDIAARTDREYAVAVNSCTAALLITHLFYASLTESMNLSLPAVSFAATGNSPTIAGYKLHFVDVDYNGLLDINQLELANTNSSSILYVNLYGNILDYNKLKVVATFANTSIPIIEDAAQSFGASYKGTPSGKLGDASCLSFDPTKNLPNYGSGGMILTDDVNLAEFAVNYRDNGKLSSHYYVGFNSMMSENDCAQMRVKLLHFDAWQQRRADIANFYTERLADIVTCPSVNDDVVHAWHKYVIQTPSKRNMLMTSLFDHGITTKIHYSRPLPMLQAFPAGRNTFPVAETLSFDSLSLPIFPELTDNEVDYITATIRKFYIS